MEYDSSRMECLVLPFAAGGDLRRIIDRGEIREVVVKKNLKALACVHTLRFGDSDIESGKLPVLIMSVLRW